MIVDLITSTAVTSLSLQCASLPVCGPPHTGATRIIYGLCGRPSLGVRHLAYYAVAAYARRHLAVSVACDAGVGRLRVDGELIYFATHDTRHYTSWWRSALRRPTLFSALPATLRAARVPRRAAPRRTLLAHGFASCVGASLTCLCPKPRRRESVLLAQTPRSEAARRTRARRPAARSASAHRQQLRGSNRGKQQHQQSKRRDQS